MTDSLTGLCTDGAVALAKSFFKQMAQPMSKESQMGVSLWDETYLKTHAQEIRTAYDPSRMFDTL